MKTRKIISLVLVFLLMSSNFVYASTGTAVTGTPTSTVTTGTTTTDTGTTEQVLKSYMQRAIEARKAQLQKNASKIQKWDQQNVPNENTIEYKPNDEVRVIIEVSGEPVSDVNTASKTTIQSLMTKQKSVVDKIESTGIDIEKRHEFVQAINGFSADVTYKDIAAISKINGVKKVHIANKYVPDMTTSLKIVNADVVNNAGLKGEGMLVAIVDTGIDHTHPDFQAVPSGQKYNKSQIESKFWETEVPDVWYSDKVPTGYDWADNDTNVIPDMTKPQASTHGTHVAGTVAANGLIKGVAPEAQLLAEKVFSDDSPYAYTDDIVAGIIHAINMDADAINMSLGSVSGFANPDDPEQYAIKLAVDKGIIVAVSAGNSTYSTFKTGYKPYIENIDTALVGSPGVATDTIQVASYENTNVMADEFEYYVAGTKASNGAYQVAGNIPAQEMADLELVYCGLGGPADFTAEVKAALPGKIALIERGAYGFADKQINAQINGAAGVVVYNSAANGDALVSMVTHPELEIPAIFVGRTAGLAMKNAIVTDKKQVTLKFTGNVVSIPNPTTKQMSSFSSWGLTPDLEFKPELSAPGGSIYSTAVGGGYQNMSGTSMASPHVAGAAALVAQSLRAKGMVKDRNLVEMAKHMLMNTANIVIDPYKVPYSPRLQGAGLMQIDQAVKTPAIIMDSNGKAAVSLKEISTSTKTEAFSLQLKSFSGTNVPNSITYNVDSVILTDKISGPFLAMSDAPLANASMSINGTPITADNKPAVTVNKNSTTNLNVILDLTKATLATERFVEGFIKLTPTTITLASPDVVSIELATQDIVTVNLATGDMATLTVPFVGFYGDWNKPKTIDPGMWDPASYMEWTGLYDPFYLQYGYNVPYGMDLAGDVHADNIAFSPNNDYTQDEAVIAWSQLRNAKSLKVLAKNSQGQVVSNIFDSTTYDENADGILDLEEGMRKHAFENIFSKDTYSLTWDGTGNSGSVLADGNYNIVFETVIDYPGAAAQTYQMPFKIDTESPSLGDITITPNQDNTYSVNWTQTDDRSGIWGSYLYIDGVPYNSNGEDYLEYTDATTIKLATQPSSVAVVTFDFAGNGSINFIGDPAFVSNDIIEFVSVDGTNISYNRPAEISIRVDRPVTWDVKVLNPQGQLVATVPNEIPVDGVMDFYGSWAPADKTVQSGMYTLSVTVKDFNDKTTTVNKPFEVYNFDMKVKTAKVTDVNGVEKTSFTQNDIVNVALEVENLGYEPQNGTIIVQAIDPNHNIVNIGYVELKDIQGQTTVKINNGFKLPTWMYQGTYTIKAFVWDNVKDMNALSKESTLSFTFRY